MEDWDKPSTSSSFPFAHAAAAWLADSFGLTTLGDMLRAAPPSEPAALDGLLSVWHP